MKRPLTKTLPVLAVIFLGAISTFAHAKLLSSSPAAGETLKISPTSIELHFSVRIQSKMSSIDVFGPSGEKVQPGPLVEFDEGKKISTSLSPIGPGAYKVSWRALSADDHMINGSFEFTVGQIQQLAAPETSSVDHSSMDHSTHVQDPGINWSQSLVRWLIYIGMMLIAGGLGFRFFVAGDAIPQVDVFDRRLENLLIAAAVIVVTGLLVSVTLQARTVTGSIGLPEILSVVRETTFGPPWLLQLVSTGAVLLAVVLAYPRKVASILAFVLSLLSLLGPSLSGHARAAWEEYSLAVLFDWLHLVAASIWIGGVFMIGLVLSSILNVVPDGEEVNQTASSVVKRFTRIAIPATILLGLTGLYNSWIHVESFSALFSTTYGEVLLMKVGITGVMIVLGGINAFRFQPRIAVANEGAAGRLFRNVKIEASLAIVVLLLAALLAFLPPAREHLPAAGSMSAAAQEAK